MNALRSDKGFWLSPNERRAFSKLCEDIPVPNPPTPVRTFWQEAAEELRAESTPVPTKRTRIDRLSRLNESTREMIDTAQSKRLVNEAAKELKKIKTDERKQRVRDYRQQIEFESVVPEPAKPVKRREPLPPELTLHIGEQIPDSVLRRDFCCWCGRAIRVVDHSIRNICLDCRPTGCPGEIRSTIVSSGIAYHGGRFHSAEW